MKSPLSIYVLVDALGWEIIRDRPFLDDVLEERRWLQTILGYSSGAIPTILSGSLPSQHGHWNLFYRSPSSSPATFPMSATTTTATPTPRSWPWAPGGPWSPTPACSSSTSPTSTAT